MVVQCSVPVLFNLASSVLYSFCSRFLVDRGRLVAFGLCVGCLLVPVRSLELELGLDAGSCTRSWTGCTFQWYWRKKKNDDKAALAAVSIFVIMFELMLHCIASCHFLIAGNSSQCL